MDSHNKETTSNYDATWLALNMYKTFAEELITYLSNTVKNLNAAIMFSDNPMYLKGKSDAFKQLVDIIANEYKLAKSDIAYSYLTTSEKKNQSIFEKNTKEYLSELQHKKIKGSYLEPFIFSHKSHIHIQNHNFQIHMFQILQILNIYQPIDIKLTSNAIFYQSLYIS